MTLVSKGGRRNESDRWFSMTVNWSTRWQAKNSWCTSRLSVQRNSEQFCYCYAFFSLTTGSPFSVGEACEIEKPWALNTIYLLAKICLNNNTCACACILCSQAHTQFLDYARNNVWSYLGSCSREWAVSEFKSTSGVLQEWNGVLLRLMQCYTAECSISCIS